jgi:predicted permease
VDWRAVLCAAGVALVAGIGAASFAIVRAQRLDPQTALRGYATTPPSSGGLGHLLTAAQVATTLVLLTTAGGLARSLVTPAGSGLETDPDHVVEVMVQLTTARLSDESALRTVFSQLRDEAAQLPGVIDATIAYAQPPSMSSRPLSDLTIERDLAGVSGTVWYGRVDQGFFNTFGIRLLEGRGIEARDTADGERVVVVSRALGNRLWLEADPVGQRFRVGPDEPWRVVVGVAANVTNTNVDQASGEMAFYTPRSQSPSWWFEGISVRTIPAAGAVVPDLRALIRTHLPDSPIIDVMTGRDRLSGLHARERFVSAILTTFAVVALVLALVGIYGAFWFFVGQRTQEMAVRLAIGASPAKVMRLVLKSSLRLVAAGLAAGIPLAIGAMVVLRWLAVGVPPVDAIALTGAVVLLTVSALAATFLPARRASRIDPIRALRER